MAKNIIKKIIIIVVLLITLFPFYYVLMWSLMSDTEAAAFSDNVFIKTFNFSNFSKAFNDGFFDAFVFTFIASILSVVIKLFISMSAGLALSNKELKYKKIMISIFVTVSALPDFLLMIGLNKLFTNANLIDGSWLLVGVAAPSGFSLFSILLFASGFSEVQNSEKMQAKLDKLSFLETFRVIYWPKISGAFVLVVVFSTLQMWNSYLWPSLFLFGTDQTALSSWIYQSGNQAVGGVAYNVRMASSVIFMIPMIILFAATQKTVYKTLNNSV